MDEDKLTKEGIEKVEREIIESLCNNLQENIVRREIEINMLKSMLRNYVDVLEKK